MGNLKAVLRPFRILFILLCKLITGLVPKDKKLVLFGAWFGQRYADNTKYLYDYCLEKNEIKAVWFTKNKAVYEYLKNSDKPVVYAGSVKGVITQMRAKMLVSTVDYGDFNIYLLSNCIIFDIGHGVAIKRSHDKGYETRYQKFFDKLIHLNVERYACATNPFLLKMAHDELPVPLDRIISGNMPRTDVFFDDRLYDHRNDFLEELVGGRRLILYAPTHRMQGRVSVDIEKIFDLPAIQSLCVKYNAVFLIKKHFYHKNETTELEQYDRIFDISNREVETQSLLKRTDVLISDYSAIYIDFLATDRPIILYLYDYRDFTGKMRELFFPIEENHVGFKAQTPDEFTMDLEKVLMDPEDQAHAPGREDMRGKYYNPGQKLGTSREHLYRNLLRLLDGSLEQAGTDR